MKTKPKPQQPADPRWKPYWEWEPCPFCGSTDLAVNTGSSFKGVDYYVLCKSCKANTGLKDTHEQAVEAWNSRPKPKRKTITDTDRLNWLESANHALIRAECKNEWAVWVDSIKCFAISSTIRGTIDKAMKADAKPKGGRS